MKKKLQAIVLSGVLTCTIAQAADSTINITGYVRDNMCRVDTGSQNFIVDLMNSATKQLFRIGAYTPSIPFNIILSPCGAYAVGVKIGFTGTADTNNSSLLKLDGVAGSAAGMGIQILDSTGNQLAINAPVANLSWVQLNPGQSNTIQFYARLMATRYPVTAGTVSATATFILEFQ
ncbi:fimbrial protein [Pantoea ananatis]|uniref:fimbrial protein n=1 Tax=Pantoea ananas TaxID=553 RepID=UPI000F86C7EE|nr:fimbrial protein [Pantoea ananatis]RQN07354.1 type 1 fimbrial protein [Pantoea ananatis]